MYNQDVLNELNDVRYLSKVSVKDREYFDTIYFSKEDYDKYKSNKFVLYDSIENKYINVVVKESEKVKCGEFCLNSYLKSKLKNRDGIENEVKLYNIKNEKVLIFNKIQLQSLELIREEKIVVSNDAFNIINSYNTSFIIAFNNIDNSHFIAHTNHIEKSNTLKNNEIRLNRKQRLALNVDRKDENINIVILPFILEAEKNEHTFTERILNFYIGKVNYSLIAKRPMSMDETFEVVRLSKSNMALLGVSESDKVKLIYKDKVVKCRVLEIKESSEIINNNSYDDNGNKLKEIDINTIIGIPAFIRNDLGIPTVVGNVSVKIERDMGYIWKKNISNQVLPIILILFTSEIFVSLSSILLSMLFALLSLPIVLYFNLSKERSIAKC